MPAFIEGPIYGGMMKQFASQFGDTMVELPTQKAAEVPFGQTQKWNGFMRAEDQNAKIVHDLINCAVPVFDHIGFEALMDFLRFLNTSLDDDVNEVKRGVRYIVGYQAACIIPQADIKITQ